MTENEKPDRIAISVRSHRLLRVLLRENPMLETIIRILDYVDHAGIEYPEYSFKITGELSNIEI